MNDAGITVVLEPALIHWTGERRIRPVRSICPIKLQLIKRDMRIFTKLAVEVDLNLERLVEGKPAQRDPVLAGIDPEGDFGIPRVYI